MELPQPRPIGNQDRKATHDFLSLYSSSSPSPVQQDPTPPQGGYLKTHDFLQPLEGVGKNEERKGVVISPPAEHLLPGGIGTYSISYFNQRVLKQPEGSLFTSTTATDENSNYTSGFTLWDESSAIKKGKTGKENIHILREKGVNVAGGQWASLLEKQSQSSSNHMNNVATFSSFSSSQPSSSHKNQSFMDMITSTKNDQEEDDDDDDEFVIKKEPSSHPKGNLSVKVESNIIDRKPNTPRSKHSATEQRRRSKINDRFQKLREIIPNSDQKRDKASFLLEVIDYIQFLQEKVNRYESSYNAWNHEPSSSSKMMQWKKCQVAEGLLDHTQRANADCGPATKFDENKAAGVSPINGQNLVDSSDISTAATLKQMQQKNIFSFGTTAATDSTDKTLTWPPSTKIKDQELTIDSGTINISTAYSQGLLNTLTQALHSSGVDLSKASISVQIDLGKRANCVPHASTLPTKEDDVTAALLHSGAASRGEEFGHALKRFRTS